MEFEFLRLIPFGQYVPADSVIHRLDPRTRLVVGIGLLFACVFAGHLLGLGAAFLALLLLLVAAQIPPLYALKGLLPTLPFVLFFATLQVFFGRPTEMTTLLLDWGPLHVTTGGLLNAALFCARFVTLFLTLILLSMCIATTELVRALDALLAPLTRLGLPTHDFIMMIQVALRFIPLLAQEAERIAKAQASRGADWGAGGRAGLVQRVRQVLPLLLPLFLLSLQRAENMALAMESRGYQSGQGRTSMVLLHFRGADGWAAVCAVALIGVIVSL